MRKILLGVLALMCTSTLWLSSASAQASGDGTKKEWRGSSGRVYELDLDKHGRVEGFKRKGSSGLKISYKYDPQTGKPIAAKIGNNKWSYQQVGLEKNSGTEGICGPKLEGAKLTNAMRNMLDRVEPTPFRLTAPSLKTVWAPGDEEVVQQTYQDFQWWMNDLNSELVEDQWASITRQQCIDACNDITDLAWLTCSAFGLLGAGGAVVGLGCAAYFYNERRLCRQACSRLPG